MKKNNLWNANEVSSILDSKIYGSNEWVANNVSIDSRTVKKGDLFIALNGPNYDGYNFLKDAFENGAIASIVNKIPQSLKSQNFIKVNDTFKALNQLGIAGRERGEYHVIGITGSVGKTTTKDFLSKILETLSTCHSSYENNNNKFGVPLSLAKIPRNTNYVVQEIGMSYPGEISKLSELLKPNLSIITSIGTSHIANFKNINQIALAKSEIFYEMSNNATVLLPKNNTKYSILHNEAIKAGIKNVFSFGDDINNHAKLIDASFFKNHFIVKAEIFGEFIKFKLNGHLSHNIYNALSSILASKLLGLEIKDCGEILQEITLKPGRGKVKRFYTKSGGQGTLIDDCYNSSLESMSSSIMSLRNISNNRPVLILGDILELGKHSSDKHESLIPLIVDSNPRVVISIGKEMTNILKKLKLDCQKFSFNNSLNASSKVLALINDNDYVLIKGSNGMKLKTIVKKLEANTPAKNQFKHNNEESHNVI